MKSRRPPVAGNSSKNTRISSKKDFLAKFQDDASDNNDLLLDEEDNYKTVRLNFPVGSVRRRVEQSKPDNYLEDGLQTLTLKSDDLATLKKNVDSSKNTKLNSLSTPILQPDKDINDTDFLIDIDDLSPGTFSASSPKSHRKTLSDYSEDVTETDDTEVSEFNDAELEDVDNIFGVEESGVYNHGGSHSVKESKAKALLKLKQRELEIKAEEEERELLEQAKNNGEFDFIDDNKLNTLKLKDFNGINSIGKQGIDRDALENEKTLNYEYTKDDFEDFEDGFELTSPIKLQSKLVSSKISVPQFGSIKDKNIPIKKYHSMADVNANPNEINEHPFFNNRNNKLLKKLNRIPSFYNKSDDINSLEDLDERKETQLRAMDIEMEKKKRELLAKYMEITNTQLQNNRRMKSKKAPKTSSKKLGLVRYLNDGCGLPSSLSQNNNDMKYNPSQHRWEGNYIDLYKFDSIKSLKTTKPHLITKEDYSQDSIQEKKADKPQLKKGEKIVGNMRYDPDLMKWINITESEDDVFAEVPDLTPAKPKKMKSQAFKKMPSSNHISNLIKHQPIASDINFHRGVSSTSAFTQKTTTSTSSDSSDDSIIGEETQMQQNLMIEINIDDKLIEKFKKEELRWIKKTKNWFGENERYDVTNTEASTYNKDYFWEIRKMVTEDTSDE